MTAIVAGLLVCTGLLIDNAADGTAAESLTGTVTVEVGGRPCELTYTESIFSGTLKIGNSRVCALSDRTAAGTLDIPATVNVSGTAYAVTQIGRSAFSDCTGLTSVTIPAGVAFIDGSAFRNCTALVSVTIPNSVDFINGLAFSKCTALKSVTIPNSVEMIAPFVFMGCAALESIYFCPDSSVNVSPHCFALGQESAAAVNCTVYSNLNSAGRSDGFLDGCKDPKTAFTYVNSLFSDGTFCYLMTGAGEVMVGDGTDVPGNGAVHGDLTTAAIPSAVSNDGVTYLVTSVGKYAFSGCTDLTSATVPDRVTSVGKYAFSGCTGLTSLTVGNGVVIVGQQAFAGCTGLTSLTLPIDLNAVVSASSPLFAGCIHLTKVAFTPGNGCGYSYSTDCFSDNCYQNTPWCLSQASLKELILADGITSVGSYAFSGCIGLTFLAIPAGLTSVGEGAFPYGFYATDGITELITAAEIAGHNYQYAEEVGYVMIEEPETAPVPSMPVYRVALRPCYGCTVFCTGGSLFSLAADRTAEFRVCPTDGYELNGQPTAVNAELTDLGGGWYRVSELTGDVTVTVSVQKTADPAENSGGSVSAATAIAAAACAAIAAACAGFVFRRQ